MSDWIRPSAVESVSVILPVMDETTSLSETVEIIVRDARQSICELLIVVCGRTTPEAMATVGGLRERFGPLVVVHHQQLPFLGGAIREAFELWRGSHVILMASDLETDPNLVKRMIDEESKHPAGIVTASRWIAGGSFQGYSRTKLVLNWIFQRMFSLLYGTRLSDMTYAYRIMPTALVQSIRWEELRHPFLFETMIKPLRLGVPVYEIPATWNAAQGRGFAKHVLPQFRILSHGSEDAIRFQIDHSARGWRPSMKKVIVTTTINPPTKAIRLFQAMKDWDLVVIGDKKTPADYRLDRGTYVTPDEQQRYDPALSDAIGWNCIQRRSFGLLWARDMGADVVAVVDDDNIPLAGWGENLLLGNEVEVDFYETSAPAFDPVGATNHGHLWHRGFPLQLLSSRDYSRKARRRVTVDVQADFWNGDPDIDAICRMEHAPECDFDPRCFPLAADKPSPFNSQNTFISGRCLRDYFLFPHVGRMDDIWASYYLQAKGSRVVYQKASVYQERNPHDLIRDMRQEYLGYENNLKLVGDLARDPAAIQAYLPGQSAWAFQLYRRHFARG